MLDSHDDALSCPGQALGAPPPAELRVVRSTGPLPPRAPDVASLTVGSLLAALVNLGVGCHPDPRQEWELVRRLREMSPTAIGPPPELRRDITRPHLRNMIVGYIGERLFIDACLGPLTHHGWDWVDDRGLRRKGDFTLRRGQAPGTFRVDVKTKGTRWAGSLELVGIHPDDDLTVSLENVRQAHITCPDLVYVMVSDPALRTRVEGHMLSMEGPEGIAYQLLSRYRGRGLERAEQQFLDVLMARRESELLDLSGIRDQGCDAFRVVHVQRLIALIGHGRATTPSLGHLAAAPEASYARADGERGAVLHVSSRFDTCPWTLFAAVLAHPTTTKGTALAWLRRYAPPPPGPGDLHTLPPRRQPMPSDPDPRAEED